MPALETKQHALKRKKLRHAEYYDMQAVFDQLYAKSKEGKSFHNLLEIINSRENILLAYRNIKRNDGSLTQGTDKNTINDIAKMAQKKFVERIQNKLAHYKPKPVRRVEIPKENGKVRPLGIPSIWDRIVQQSILQVLDPICEARFNDHSYGFRPNRSAEHAIADYMKRVNLQKLYFVVDVDICGFFDNVNHAKLIKQMWTMGIRDKRLLVIIRKMLKAPIIKPDGSVEIPTVGCPQGGLCSPILSNIVLNELDWWIASQWETAKAIEKYAHHKDKGSAFKELRKTKLKEVYIVRYADDFRIFCKTRSAADKIFVATQNWLKERLKLEISAEKSKVTNLKKVSAEFLGFKFKAIKKAGKRVINSWMSDKAEKKVTQKLKDQIKQIQKPHESSIGKEVWKYNTMVIGVHNYYRIATHIAISCRKIARTVNTAIKNRLEGVERQGELDPKGYTGTKYGKSDQLTRVSQLW
jgi:group II intron reverse transcriptase/maturase